MPRAFADNLKWLLMSLVVCGHAVEPLIHQDPAMKALYVFIYSFHMPLFVAVSGYLSRPATTFEQHLKLAIKTLLPLAIFQLLYSAFDAWVFAHPFTLSWITPYWLLWYLLSLFWWRAALAVLTAFRGAWALALVAALSAGTTSALGYPLSASRTVVFLPFFLLGHGTTPAALQWLQRRSMRALALFALAVAALAAAPSAAGLDVRWLHGSFSYASLGVGLWEGVAMRTVLTLLALLMGAAVVSLTPTGELAITRFGRTTLTAYLLHGFAMKGAIASGLDARLAQTPWRWALLPAAFVLTVLLSSEHVARWSRWLVDPSRLVARLRNG